MPRGDNQLRLSQGKTLTASAPLSCLKKKFKKCIVRSATPNQVHPGNYQVYCKLFFHLGTIICRFLPFFFIFQHCCEAC